jgi:hypothetical protein
MSKQKTKNQAAQEPAGAPNCSGGPPAKGAYKVGYRRPPAHTRFKKGRSGNPNGRLKGSANAKTIISRVINEKVTVREGDKARDMTKLEGMLQAHLVKAIKGDARSASLVINLVARLGLLADTETQHSPRWRRKTARFWQIICGAKLGLRKERPPINRRSKFMSDNSIATTSDDASVTTLNAVLRTDLASFVRKAFYTVSPRDSLLIQLACPSDLS